MAGTIASTFIKFVANAFKVIANINVEGAARQRTTSYQNDFGYLVLAFVHH